MTFPLPLRPNRLLAALIAGTALLTGCDRSGPAGEERRFEFPATYIAQAESIRAGQPVPAVAAPLRPGMAISIGPDSAIAAYFVTHRAVFDSIATQFRKRIELSTVDVLVEPQPERRDGALVPANRNAQLRALLETAGASAVFRDVRHPGCVFVRMGGVGRLHVGYVFVPVDMRVPPVNRGTVVAIVPIEKGWYIYKTV